MLIVELGKVYKLELGHAVLLHQRLHNVAVGGTHSDCLKFAAYILAEHERSVVHALYCLVSLEHVGIVVAVFHRFVLSQLSLHRKVSLLINYYYYNNFFVKVNKH